MQPVVKNQNGSYLLQLVLGGLALCGTGSFAIYFMVKHGEGPGKIMANGTSSPLENTDSGSTGSSHIELNISGTSGVESSQANDGPSGSQLVSEFNSDQGKSNDQNAEAVVPANHQSMEYSVLRNTRTIDLRAEPWMKELRGNRTGPIAAQNIIVGCNPASLKTLFTNVEPMVNKIYNITSLLSSDYFDVNYVDNAHYQNASPSIRDTYDQWSKMSSIMDLNYTNGIYKERIGHISVAFAATFAFYNILRYKSIDQFNEYIEPTGPFKTLDIKELIENIKRENEDEYNKISRAYGPMENYVALCKEAYGIMFEYIRNKTLSGTTISFILDERFLMANDLYLRLYLLHELYNQASDADKDRNEKILKDLFPCDNNCISQPKNFYNYSDKLQNVFNMNIEIIQCAGQENSMIYDMSHRVEYPATPINDDYAFRMLHFKYTLANRRVFEAYHPVIPDTLIYRAYQF